MSIEITNGFSIVPHNNTPVADIGNYYLSPTYSPANNIGSITIPLHTTNPGQGGLDFNEVNENTGNAIYINLFDSNNTNNSTYLLQLVGNHTHLTFTQNTYHITFDCLDTAWETGQYTGNQVYHDPNFENAPQNSITIISTSGYTFNDTDPIGITIQVI